jgi:hypothetical protein
VSLAARLAPVLVLAPAPVDACATCLGSAYGDRTFNLAFLSLLVMPFMVSAVIGGVLAYAHRHRRVPRPVDQPIKETT